MHDKQLYLKTMLAQLMTEILMQNVHARIKQEKKT